MGEDDEGVIGFIKFVIARKDSPELLDITEVTLHPISSFL
jgi:tetrahydromethanopterin S-methyltransferase subunit H